MKEFYDKGKGGGLLSNWPFNNRFTLKVIHIKG